MSPILVRPVREQLEHDRVIRLLQARWRRKFLVSINPGSETATSVTDGNSVLYPDLVLASTGRGHKPQVVVEVETAESVNNLEALAQWVPLGKLRTDFYLCVPAGSVDPARRLCQDHSINVDEIWTYHPVGDQMRFTMVFKAPAPTRPQRAAARPRPPSRAARPAPARRPQPGGLARKATAPRPTKRTPAKRARPGRAAARPARSQKRK